MPGEADMSDMDSVTAAIVRSGVVAVLRASTVDGFAAVADVLVEAGITAIEVTLTSRGAVDALAGLRRRLPPAAVVGPRYVKDLHGPLPDVRIMPTGGIDVADVETWLRNGAAAVGLGSPLIGDAPP